MRWIAFLLCALSLSKTQAQDIAFSIHNKPLNVFKSDFSIHESVVPTTAVTKSEIPFSIHELPKNLGSLPSSQEPNRVFVFIDTTPIRQTVRTQVCYGGFCRWEDRVVEQPATKSLQTKEAVTRLAKESTTWKVASSEDADGDFLIVDLADTRNKKLAEEFNVTSSDCPILMKEVDPTIRTQTEVSTPAQLADWWNSNKITGLTREQVTAVRQSRSQQTSKTVKESTPSAFRSSSREWTYPGNIRQHLMDPASPHHLPKALLDSWSDDQCVKWHNWHHEYLEGRATSYKQSFQHTLPA